MFLCSPIFPVKAKTHKYYSISVVHKNYTLILAKLGKNAKCKK